VLRRGLTPEQIGGARVGAEIVDADTGKPLEPIQAQVDSTDMRNPTPNPRPFGIELKSGSVSVDYVPPGSWTFWVSANARSEAYTPFRVRPDDKLIQLKIAVGSPASVSGNVVFGGLEKPVSADVCGRLTQVSFHPGWVETSRIYPYAKLRDDGSFEFAKLIPGHWKISLRSPTLIAEAEIDLMPGRNGHVQLVAERAGMILFKTTPLADGLLDVVLVEPGMTGTPEELAGATRYAFPVAKDGFYTGSVPVRGGRYHWTAKWLDGVNANDTPVSIEPQSGDVDVVAGERREIELQLIRK
jgi:hypothetical protein